MEDEDDALSSLSDRLIMLKVGMSGVGKHFFFNLVSVIFFFINITIM